MGYLATPKQKAFLDKNKIEYPQDCNVILAGRLIGAFLNSIPATPKQKRYLERLGYCGDIEKISFARAGAEIESLRAKELNARVPF